MFKVLAHRKGDIVVIFVKVIMEKQSTVTWPLPATYLSMRMFPLSVIGIIEVSIEVGDVELIRVVLAFEESDINHQFISF